MTSSFSILLQVSVQVQGEEFQYSIIFQDDFEVYDLDIFPSKGGWELVWNGRGDEYQHVTNEYWHSPTKSLQLWGQDGWSAVAERRFSSDSMIIGFDFEGCVLIESYSSKPSGTPVAARIYLWNRELATWGKLYAGVDFTYDGNITARHGLGTPTFGKWSPRTWYRVKLILDRSANTFDVWINGEDDISVLPEYQDTYNIDALALYSDHAGVKVYFDDVKVFAQAEESRYEYWLPWTDNTWPPGSCDLCSYIQFLIFEDNTIIQIDSDHDGVADAELSGNAGEKLMWGYATSYGSPKPGLDIFPPIGTLIKTNKPVSAFYYHTTNDWGIYDDHTYAYSLIPTFLLGCSYYIWTESTLASILSTVEDNEVFIDENDDGHPEYSFTLGYGEYYIYSNTKAGAHIWAEKPIAVVVANWDPSYDTETYAYELYPISMLSSEYSCPYPNPGIQYYEESTSKCKVIIGAVYEDTTVNIDEDGDGAPEITQSLSKARYYEYRNPKPGAKIYGTKEFYAIYIFDVYARDSWASVYRDYMYAYMIPPASISGKQFLMLDLYESYHATYTSVNIFVLEDETEIYVDRGFDGTTDETYQANKGEVINIVGKLRYNLTKIIANKPVTAAYSWEGGWVGVSEAILGFTLIPLDILLPKINAIITAYSISPGEFKYGDKVSAQVTVKNIGEKAWTFYVGFSVQDPNGKWWDAPYETVTLNPNEEEMVTLYWTVPSEAPAGSYNARVAVWGGKQDDKLINLLDYADVYAAFNVLSRFQMLVNYAKKVVLGSWVVFSGILSSRDKGSLENELIKIEDSAFPDRIEYVRTDKYGRFFYCIHVSGDAPTTRTVKFSWNGLSKTCVVEFVKADRIYNVICINALFKDEQAHRLFEVYSMMKSSLASAYFLHQSSGKIGVRYVFLTTVVLPKTYEEYGLPDPNWQEDPGNWKQVRDDAVAEAKKIVEDFPVQVDAITVIVQKSMRAFTEHFKWQWWEPPRIILSCNASAPEKNFELYKEWYWDVYDLFGTWVHETAHALFRLKDFYLGLGAESEGDLYYWDIMGAGTDINPPAPFSSITRLKLGWLEEQEAGWRFIAPWLIDLQYGDKVPTHSFFSRKYYFECRSYPDDVSSVAVDDGDSRVRTLSHDSGVNIYVYEGGLYKVKIMQGYEKPTIPLDYKGILDFDPEHRAFLFIESKYKDGQVYINLTKEELPPSDYVAMYTKTTYVPPFIHVPRSVPISVYPFDIDLKFISIDGRIVGMNYTTGAYEVEIDGAYTRGNVLGCGQEWIMVPRMTSGFFILDPFPAMKYCESLGIPYQNVTVLVEYQFAYIDNQGVVHMCPPVNITVPIDRETVIPIPVTVDVDPKTMNLGAEGKWITAYIELPESYNVSDINASSILLNDTIPVDLSAPIAVGDYDENGVLDLMVKFDRASVISYLLANVNRTRLFKERFMIIALTVTGKLNDGTPVKGSDIITIVMPMPRAIYKTSIIQHYNLDKLRR